MFERFTKNIYTDFYINAAKKLGIQFIIPFKGKSFILLNRPGKKDLFLHAASIGINNSIAYELSKKKFYAYRFFDLKKIPHPEAILLRKEQDLNKELSKLKIQPSWVVKPNTGYGGQGVAVDIHTKEILRKACTNARKFNPSIVVEKYVPGKHYRILLFNYEIIDAVRRIPANVTGDGIHTIKELIDQKNNKRKSCGMKEIVIDFELEKELKNQNLTFNKILKGHQTVYLRKNCNMATGGETTRIPMKDIHEDNKKIFVEAAKVTQLKFAGVDFISNDIKVSYKSNNAVVNEINRDSSLDVHYFADMRMDNFLAEKILKMHFHLK